MLKGKRERDTVRGDRKLRSDRMKVRGEGGERKGRVGEGLMRGWRMCGGGNQRDCEMNERTLKRRSL